MQASGGPWFRNSLAPGPGGGGAVWLAGDQQAAEATLPTWGPRGPLQSPLSLSWLPSHSKESDPHSRV